MKRVRYKSQSAFIDIVSLIGIGFLLITLVTAVSVTNNPVRQFIFDSFAKSCDDIGNPKKRQACKASNNYDPNSAANVAYRAAHPEIYETTTIKESQKDGSIITYEVVTKNGNLNTKTEISKITAKEIAELKREEQRLDDIEDRDAKKIENEKLARDIEQIRLERTETDQITKETEVQKLEDQKEGLQALSDARIEANKRANNLTSNNPFETEVNPEIERIFGNKNEYDTLAVMQEYAKNAEPYTNNYAITNGNETLNQLLSLIDNPMSTVFNNKWSNYTSSFTTDKVTEQWETKGYSSLQDCQSKNFGRGALQCAEIDYTKEQTTSSVKLGVDITNKAATVVAPYQLAGSAGGSALVMNTFKVLGGVGTLGQTGEAVTSHIEAPGSQDAWIDTGFAALSWLNLGTSDALLQGYKYAPAVNTAVTGANATADTYEIITNCTSEDKSGCGTAIVAGVTDAVFGFADWKQGELFKLTKNISTTHINTPAVDIPITVNQKVPDVYSGGDTRVISDLVSDRNLSIIDLWNIKMPVEGADQIASRMTPNQDWNDLVTTMQNAEAVPARVDIPSPVQPVPNRIVTAVQNALSRFNPLANLSQNLRPVDFNIPDEINPTGIEITLPAPIRNAWNGMLDGIAQRLNLNLTGIGNLADADVPAPRGEVGLPKVDAPVAKVEDKPEPARITDDNTPDTETKSATTLAGNLAEAGTRAWDNWIISPIKKVGDGITEAWNTNVTNADVPNSKIPEVKTSKLYVPVSKAQEAVEFFEKNYSRGDPRFRHHTAGLNTDVFEFEGTRYMVKNPLYPDIYVNNTIRGQDLIAENGLSANLAPTTFVKNSEGKVTGVQRFIEGNTLYFVGSEKGTQAIDLMKQHNIGIGDPKLNVIHSDEGPIFIDTEDIFSLNNAKLRVASNPEVAPEYSLWFSVDEAKQFAESSPSQPSRIAGIRDQIQVLWTEKIVNPVANYFDPKPTTITTSRAIVAMDTKNNVVTKNPLSSTEINKGVDTKVLNLYPNYLENNFEIPARFYEQFGGQADIPKYLGRTPEGGFKIELKKGVVITKFKGNLTQGEVDRAIATLKSQQELTGLPHGDIWGDNILVETLDNGTHTIHFIDFGSSGPSALALNGPKAFEMDIEQLNIYLDDSRAQSQPSGLAKLGDQIQVFGVEAWGGVKKTFDNALAGVKGFFVQRPIDVTGTAFDPAVGIKAPTAPESFGDGSTATQTRVKVIMQTIADTTSGASPTGQFRIEKMVAIGAGVALGIGVDQYDKYLDKKGEIGIDESIKNVFGLIGKLFTQPRVEDVKALGIAVSDLGERRRTNMTVSIPASAPPPVAEMAPVENLKPEFELYNQFSDEYGYNIIYGDRTWRNIGCGFVAIANILTEHGIPTTPEQVLEMVKARIPMDQILRDGGAGFPMNRNSVFMDILKEYGFNYVDFEKHGGYGGSISYSGSFIGKADRLYDYMTSLPNHENMFVVVGSGASSSNGILNSVGHDFYMVPLWEEQGSFLLKDDLAGKDMKCTANSANNGYECWNPDHTEWVRFETINQEVNIMQPPAGAVYTPAKSIYNSGIPEEPKAEEKDINQFITVDIPFISQYDPSVSKIGMSGGGCTVETMGCTIASAAMITKQSIPAFIADINIYQGFDPNGENPYIDCAGSSIKTYRDYFENNGYNVVPISGNFAQKVEAIKQYTQNGIPIWVDTTLCSDKNGDKCLNPIDHAMVIVGVDDENNLIYNNSVSNVGGTTYTETQVDLGNFTVNAIVPEQP